jgi:rare lipoprotein A
VLFRSGFLVSSCGITRKSTSTSLSSYDNAKPIESGVSSWYGPNFHGKLTANGEKYDMDGVTAAHRTLPFGSIVLVENLDNGKTVQVRINDRGPYAKNRIIDLSRGAAEKIDMIGPGTARVRLYLLEGDLQKSRVTNLKVPNYTVQLGSYKSKPDAEAQAKKVKNGHVEKVIVHNETYYRVYAGSFTDAKEAQKEMKRLNRMGFAGFVKQIENN